MVVTRAVSVHRYGRDAKGEKATSREPGSRARSHGSPLTVTALSAPQPIVTQRVLEDALVVVAGPEALAARQRSNEVAVQSSLAKNCVMVPKKYSTHARTHACEHACTHARMHAGRKAARMQARRQAHKQGRAALQLREAADTCGHWKVVQATGQQDKKKPSKPQTNTGSGERSVGGLRTLSGREKPSQR